MLETLVDHNDRKHAPLSNRKIRQAVSKVMSEKEEDERDSERNANNVTMDIFFHQPPITANTQGEICKHDKCEANFFGKSGRNDERI